MADRTLPNVEFTVRLTGAVHSFEATVQRVLAEPVDLGHNSPNCRCWVQWDEVGGGLREDSCDERHWISTREIDRAHVPVIDVLNDADQVR